MSGDCNYFAMKAASFSQIIIYSWEIEYKKNNKDSELPPLTFDDIKKLLKKESSEMDKQQLDDAKRKVMKEKIVQVP